MLERTAYLAQGLPGIVVALSMVSLTITLLARSIRRRPADGRLAILFLPLALVSVRAALGRCSAGWRKPAASPAWLVRDLPARAAAVGRAGSGRRRGDGLRFDGDRADRDLADGANRHPHACGSDWADTSTLAFAAAAPYAALMMALSLVSAWLLARRFGVTRMR